LYRAGKIGLGAAEHFILNKETVMESVISPMGGETVGTTGLAARPASLNGKTVGEIWNEDFKGDVMFPAYRELLRQRYPDVKIVPYTELPHGVLKGTPAYQRDVISQIASALKDKGVDAVISGNGG
jgi:hypothetical protein